MSVLISGMKLPKDCVIKVAIRGDDGIASVYLDEGKADYYSVIELPDHGDLIDREALMSEIADWQLTESPEEGRNWWLGKDVTSHEMQYCIYRLLGDVYEEVRDIPVVIPAERSEDGET